MRSLSEGMYAGCENYEGGGGERMRSILLVDSCIERDVQRYH